MRRCLKYDCKSGSEFIMGWLFEVVENDENGDLEGNGPSIKKVVSAVGRSQWVDRRFECEE